jgi:hypothetical protein
MENLADLVRKDDPKIAITGTLDQVPAVAVVEGAGLDADGRIEVEFAGGSNVDWDSQTTVCRGGERIFIDENGEEVPETEVVLRSDGAVVHPPWRPPAPSAGPSIEPMMVISTAHAGPATLDALQSEAGEGAPHRVIPHAYGAILYVGEEAPCAADLAPALALARRLGCVWLNLDCDGPEVAELPLHNWGAEGWGGHESPNHSADGAP